MVLDSYNYASFPADMDEAAFAQSAHLLSVGSPAPDGDVTCLSDRSRRD